MYTAPARWAVVPPRSADPALWRDCVFATCLAFGPDDLVGRIRATPFRVGGGAVPSPAVGVNGLAYRFDRTGGNTALLRYGFPDFARWATGDVTLFVFAHAATSGVQAGLAMGTGGSRRVSIYRETDNSLRARVDGSSSYVLQSPGASVGAGVTFTGAFTQRGTTLGALYLNGARVASNSSPAALPANAGGTDEWVLGSAHKSWADGFDGGWDGLIYTALVWNRALDASEVRALAIDPYRMFRPRRRPQRRALAFPAGFTLAATLNIPAAKVSGAGVLSNFPVLIARSNLPDSFCDPSGAESAQADGGDVRITSDIAGANRLPLDIKAFEHDSATAAGDAKVAIYTKADLDGTNGTSLYLWRGGSGSETQPAAGEPYGSQAVWASNYVLVDHAVSGADSTGNGNNGTKTGVSPEWIETKVANWNGLSHQGLSWDGTHYIMIDTADIYKYLPDGTLVAHNSTPFADVTANVNHLGGCDIYNGEIYLAADNWVSCSNNTSQTLIVYKVSDLSYVREADIDSTSVSAAGVALDVPSNEMYVNSFCNSEMYVYDMTTFAHKRTVTISPETKFIQDLFLFEGNLLASENLNSTIWKIAKDGTRGDAFYTGNTNGGMEGICQRGDNIEFLKTTGTGNGVIHTLSRTGKNHDALFLTGSQYVSYGSILPTTEGSISAWFMPSRIFDYNAIFDNAIDKNNWEGWTDSNSGGKFFGRASNADPDKYGYVISETARASARTFYRYVYSWKNGGNATLYINGAADGVDPYITQAASTFYIGGGNPLNTKGEGIIEELRITNVAPSADYVATEYANLSDPGSFLTAGIPSPYGLITEAAQASDAFFAVARAAAALSAGAAAGESWVAQAQVLADLIESAGAADAIAAASISAAQAAISESSTASAAFVASVSAIAQVTGIARAGANFSAASAGVFEGSITGGAAVSDALIATVTTIGAVGGGAVIGDSWTGALAQLLGAVTDNVTADALMSARAAASSMLTASAAASATFSARLPGKGYLIAGAITLTAALSGTVTLKPH